MFKTKEEEYKYHDYVDEYSGIPVYERELVEDNGEPGKRQLTFSFDTDCCPAYDK